MKNHPKPNDHHLVLGTLKDILTGNTITDTHDARYRQKIARLMLKNGFEKQDIQGPAPHELTAGSLKARINIDYLVRFKNKIVLFIKYAPGSLVTRRQSTLALSRTVSKYQIPFVVVTNGEDAEIIEGDSGQVIAHGMNKIPTKEIIENNFNDFSFKPISPKIFEQASRIAYACEVDGACPCDTDICIIESKGVS